MGRLEVLRPPRSFGTAEYALGGAAVLFVVGIASTTPSTGAADPDPPAVVGLLLLAGVVLLGYGALTATETATKRWLSWSVLVVVPTVVLGGLAMEAAGTSDPRGLARILFAIAVSGMFVGGALAFVAVPKQWLLGSDESEGRPERVADLDDDQIRARIDELEAELRRREGGPEGRFEREHRGESSGSDPRYRDRTGGESQNRRPRYAEGDVDRGQED